MERVACGISGEKPSAIRAIKDEVPSRQRLYVSARLVERFSERTGGLKAKMARDEQGTCNGIREHSLAELAAPQNHEL